MLSPLFRMFAAQKMRGFGFQARQVMKQRRLGIHRSDKGMLTVFPGYNYSWIAGAYLSMVILAQFSGVVLKISPAADK